MFVAIACSFTYLRIKEQIMFGILIYESCGPLEATRINDIPHDEFLHNNSFRKFMEYVKQNKLIMKKNISLHALIC